MDDLVQFLRNRLDEDERIARAATQGWYGYEPEQAIAFVPTEDTQHIARHDPARVLREVDAKQRILDDVLPTMQADELRIAGEWGVGSEPVREASDDLLSLLALPYADHPDYRSEWAA